MSYEDQYKEAKTTGNLTNLTPKYVEFNERGDKLLGKFIARTEVQSNTNKKYYYQYLFDTDFGLAKCHLGSATDTEVGQFFKADHVYMIDFQGKLSIAGGKSVNKYNIDEINIGHDEDIGL